jgi:hypothetical protein
VCKPVLKEVEDEEGTPAPVKKRKRDAEPEQEEKKKKNLPPILSGLLAALMSDDGDDEDDVDPAYKAAILDIEWSSMPWHKSPFGLSINRDACVKWFVMHHDQIEKAIKAKK